MDTLGRRLTLARTRRHLSQEAVARRADISLNHYRRLEQDKHSPTLATLTRVAAALGVTINTLSPKSGKTGQDSHSYPEDLDPFPAAS